jgi:hypothetical protein
MRLLLAGMLSVWLSCVTLDAQAENLRKLAEASMLVKGTVEIKPDGSVNGYAIDGAEKLAPVVIEVIQKNIPTWKFQLAAASTTVVKETMSLRLVAKAVDDKQVSVSIVGATFGNDQGSDEEHVRYKTRKPPQYPRMALDARVSGTVYLLARIGQDGRVQNVSAEQVNLRTLADKTLMERYRANLAGAAIAAAKDWTYDIPTKGEHVHDPYWYVRVPVDFEIHVFGEPVRTATEYGQWEVYIPGPKQEIPWVQDRALLSDAPDAIP